MANSDEKSTGPSRRSFVKRGSLVTGGIAIGLSGANVMKAQDPGGKALMFNDEFRPGSRFRVVSPVLEQTPDVAAVQEQNIWGGTNTRAIEYLNTNERVLFFPVDQATVEQGRIYEFSPYDLSVYQDEEGIVSVGFELPSGGTEDPDQNTATDEGYDLTDGGGKALIALNNFYPEALFRIVSDVVEWAPREDVQGSDISEEYNTRFGEYHNSSDEFFVYPAHSADVEREALYVMRDEFDATDPEGDLVTTHFDRVDESTLETPIDSGIPSNGTRRSPTEQTRETTETGGQPGFGPLLASLGIGGGLLARALARQRE